MFQYNNAMDSTRDHSLRFRLSISVLFFFLVASSIVLLCGDTRKHGRIFQSIKLNHRISSSNKPWKNLKSLKHFLDIRNDYDSPLFSFSNFDDSSYGSPSLSLPPLSSQAPQPTSSSSSSSPYPYTPILTPPNLPGYSPNSNPPPSPKKAQSPSLSPPSKHGPSPPKAYSPPNVYPPPAPLVSAGSSPPPPSPHNKRPQSVGHWCVAKPTVPDTIIKQAMDYACGSGADCKEIQPNKPCYEPNTMLAHASYAFNSYWQNRKSTGGTCDFGGTAMLVTVDPSFEKCHFTMS